LQWSPNEYITKQFVISKPAQASRPLGLILHHKEPMKHSIALVTGTTSGLGYAAARMLARVQETASQLEAETKTRVFIPLELDLDAPTSVQSALEKLVRLVSCHDCNLG
jgi:hypothetical protein